MEKWHSKIHMIVSTSWEDEHLILTDNQPNKRSNNSLSILYWNMQTINERQTYLFLWLQEPQLARNRLSILIRQRSEQNALGFFSLLGWHSHASTNRKKSNFDSLSPLLFERVIDDNVFILTRDIEFVNCNLIDIGKIN